MAQIPRIRTVEGDTQANVFLETLHNDENSILDETYHQTIYSPVSKRFLHFHTIKYTEYIKDSKTTKNKTLLGKK